MKDDKYFLQLALDKANEVNGKHKFGALVVVDGEVVSIDCNHVWERKDPSAHAEVCAIRIATTKIGSHNINGATLYGSHEPCVMCFVCAAWSGIERIVFANRANNETHDSYEFTELSLEDLAEKINRNIKIDYIKLG